jgi:hypothetical protein
MQCGTHTRNPAIASATQLLGLPTQCVREENMQDHMVPFSKNGKKYVKNRETGKVMEVADIQLPSFNEMDSMRAYPPDGLRPKNFKPKD